MSTFRQKPSPTQKTPEATSQYSPIPRSEQVVRNERTGSTFLALGQFLYEYHLHDSHANREKWIKAIAVASLSALVVGLVRGTYGILNYGRAAASGWSLPFFITAGIFLAIWLVVLLSVKERKICIHQNGLSLWESGSRAVTLRWSEIAGISFLQEKRSILWQKTDSYSSMVYPNQGKAVRLEKYCAQKNIAELATQIKARIYPDLERQLRKSLWENKSVYFGEVGVSADHLSFQGKIISWRDVTQMDIENGFLRVNLLGHPEIRISLLQVPNIELLFPIARLAKEVGYLETKQTFK